MGKMDDLFDVRFLLSEHAELLINPEYEKTLVPKPIVDDQDFGEMNFRIYDSTQYDYPITIYYWVSVHGEKGKIESAFGVVKSIDPSSKRIKLVNDWGMKWVDVCNVVKVRKGYRLP